MKLSAATFYALLAGLFAIAIRDVLFGYEENGCSMTYMFEYPEYQRIRLPKRLQRQYPSYGLYLYGEGIYAEENKKLKLTGIPVLFLPGNAGSYKQARSLGSVALRKAENMDSRFHLNVFTVDFNEELVALYGGSLQRQTKFIHECIRAILKLYKDQAAPPSSVAVVGHSMGGIVARALFTLPKFNHRLISLIITQATPHQGPVLPLDSDLLEFALALDSDWAQVLCKELVLATVRTFFNLVDPDTKQITEDPEKRMAVIRHHFVRHPVKIYDDTEDDVTTFSVPLEVWTKVLAPRLSYTSPKEMSSWLFGCTQSNGPACGSSVTQISARLHSCRPDNTSTASLQLHTSPGCRVGWLQAGWSALSLPPLDVPPLSEEGGDWSPLVSLLLFMFGSAIAYWGSALLGLSLSLLSVPLSAIHRPSTSPSSGRLGSCGQISLMVFLVVICWTTCGALALIITYLIYLYKVLRLQMSERTLKHVLNLAPRQSSGRAAGPGVCVKEGGGEAVEALGPEGSAVSCNGSDLVSVSALEDTSEDLYLHLTLLTLLTLPVLLSAPSFIYWTKNLRYSLHLDPDPCWPVAIVLVISAVLLMSSSTASIRTSKLLKASARLQFPVSIAMVAFALLHLYRVAHFIALTLSLHALSCLI
ncbi:UNVERIFIED_CONTAM: hypothetical protein FKN15_053804 [Acipenser sinensis]